MNDLQLDEYGYLLKEPAQPGHLQIFHLLLWTAMTAMLLAWNQAASQSSDGDEWVLDQVRNFLAMPLLGAGLSAWALMCAGWFWGRSQFPTQPGHWLLLALGLTAAAYVVTRPFTFAAPTSLASELIAYGIFLACELLFLVFYGSAIYAARDYWVVLFWGGLAASGIMALTIVLTCIDLRWYDRLSIVQHIIRWVFLFATLVLVCVDRQQQRKRDALHWVGVIVICGYFMYVTALPFLVRLLREVHAA